MTALAAAAEAVLRGNDAGGWTRPAAGQYPHQWNWDSALVSLGWARIDWERAVAEIESLLEAQWQNGMIPHIRFSPRHLDDYFPGPDRWPNSGRHRPPGVLTSGISNPPVLVTAVRVVADQAPDPERRDRFLRAVVPALERWLRFFTRERRVDGSPLIAVVHPWETGWDNSPRWDHLRSAGLKPRQRFQRLDTLHVGAEQRPDDRDYDSYLALVELLDACDYSVERYRAVSPFLVHDVFFDACWYRAAEDVNALAAGLGLPQPFAQAELEEFAAAFDARHWDPEFQTYLDFDIVAGERIRVATPAGLATTISGLVSRERALRIWDAYIGQGPGLRPVWSLSPRHPAFDPVRYWRGPVWVHLNWLIARGLETAGLAQQAADLDRGTLELVRASGFHEHYSPIDGMGAGAGAFSWPAALALDLLARAPTG